MANPNDSSLDLLADAKREAALNKLTQPLAAYEARLRGGKEAFVRCFSEFVENSDMMAALEKRIAKDPEKYPGKTFSHKTFNRVVKEIESVFAENSALDIFTTPEERQAFKIIISRNSLPDMPEVETLGTPKGKQQLLDAEIKRRLGEPSCDYNVKAIQAACVEVLNQRSKAGVNAPEASSAVQPGSRAKTAVRPSNKQPAAQPTAPADSDPGMEQFVEEFTEATEADIRAENEARRARGDVTTEAPPAEIPPAFDFSAIGGRGGFTPPPAPPKSKNELATAIPALHNELKKIIDVTNLAIAHCNGNGNAKASYSNLEKNKNYLTKVRSTAMALDQALVQKFTEEGKVVHGGKEQEWTDFLDESVRKLESTLSINKAKTLLHSRQNVSGSLLRSAIARCDTNDSNTSALDPLDTALARNLDTGKLTRLGVITATGLLSLSGIGYMLSRNTPEKPNDNGAQVAQNDAPADPVVPAVNPRNANPANVNPPVENPVEAANPPAANPGNNPPANPPAANAGENPVEAANPPAANPGNNPPANPPAANAGENPAMPAGPMPAAPDPAAPMPPGPMPAGPAVAGPAVPPPAAPVDPLDATLREAELNKYFEENILPSIIDDSPVMKYTGLFVEDDADGKWKLAHGTKLKIAEVPGFDPIWSATNGNEVGVFPPANQQARFQVSYDSDPQLLKFTVGDTELKQPNGELFTIKNPRFNFADLRLSELKGYEVKPAVDFAAYTSKLSDQVKNRDQYPMIDTRHVPVDQIAVRLHHNIGYLRDDRTLEETWRNPAGAVPESYGSMLSQNAKSPGWVGICTATDSPYIYVSELDAALMVERGEGTAVKTVNENGNEIFVNQEPKLTAFAFPTHVAGSDRSREDVNWQEFHFIDPLGRQEVKTPTANLVIAGQARPLPMIAGFPPKNLQRQPALETIKALVEYTDKTSERAITTTDPKELARLNQLGRFIQVPPPFIESEVSNGYSAMRWEPSRSERAPGGAPPRFIAYGTKVGFANVVGLPVFSHSTSLVSLRDGQAVQPLSGELVNAGRNLVVYTQRQAREPGIDWKDPETGRPIPNPANGLDTMTYDHRKKEVESVTPPKKAAKAAKGKKTSSLDHGIDRARRIAAAENISSGMGDYVAAVMDVQPQTPAPKERRMTNEELMRATGMDDTIHDMVSRAISEGEKRGPFDPVQFALDEAKRRKPPEGDKIGKIVRGEEPDEGPTQGRLT